MEYLKVLEDIISDGAKKMLANISCSQEEKKVDLVLVTGLKMGFNSLDIPRLAIYHKAIRSGLQICPAEVGPALCEQYLDQPTNDKGAIDKAAIFVGMEPITVDGYPLVFGVSRNIDRGKAFLGSFWSYPNDDIWRTLWQLVFVRPYK